MWIDRRALLVGVAASLLLNVFLLGILIGHAFEAGGARRNRGCAGLVDAAHVRALTSEDRRRFNSVMAQHRPAIRAAREGHRAARRAAVVDIAAPSFDRAKVAADFIGLRQANARVGEAVDAALVDALAALSPEARATLVEGVGKPAAR